MKVYEKQTFTVDELAEEFGVSYRTMLRYLHELSGLGVPLYSEVGKNGGYSILNSKAKPPLPSQQTESLHRVIKPVTHVVGVEFKAPFTAVYMAKVIVPRLWEELSKQEYHIRNPIQNGTRIGLSLSRNRIYHYIAGLEVTRPQDVPDHLVSITIPTQEYVVYTHNGALYREEKDQTYFYMLDKMRKHGLDHDPNAYGLEIYKHDQQEITIYIPII